MQCLARVGWMGPIDGCVHRPADAMDPCVLTRAVARHRAMLPARWNSGDVNQVDPVVSARGWDSDYSFVLHTAGDPEKERHLNSIALKVAMDALWSKTYALP